MVESAGSGVLGGNLVEGKIGLFPTMMDGLRAEISCSELVLVLGVTAGLGVEDTEILSLPKVEKGLITTIGLSVTSRSISCFESSVFSARSIKEGTAGGRSAIGLSFSES